jgi:hypothetical protein
MKRVILFVLMMLASVGTCQAQSSAVSGHLADLGLNNVTSANTYVSFVLQGYGSNIPKITGSNVIVSATSPPFRPDGSGNISGNITRNDFITPATTFYQVCVFNQGTQFRCNNYLIAASTFNLNTATPLNPTPPPYTPFAVVTNPLGTQNVIQPGITQLQVNAKDLVGLSTTSAVGGRCIQDVLSGGIFTFQEASAACGSGGGGGGVPFPGPNPWFDVTNSAYAGGAICDGTTDDSAAFQAAINAQQSFGGGSVFIPPNFTPCYLHHTLTTNATNNRWLNFLQAGSITADVSILDSDSNTAIGGLKYTDFVYWLGIPGNTSGYPQSFGDPSAPDVIETANVPAFHLHSSQTRLENLNVECSGATTADCVNWYTTADFGFAQVSMVNVNSSLSTGATGTPLNFDCHLAEAAGNGCFSVSVVGGRYAALSTATNKASIWFRDVGAVVVGGPDRRMSLGGYGILIQQDGHAAAPAGLFHIQNILTEAMTGPLVTTYNSGAEGAGIVSIAIDRVDVADCSGTCSIFKASSAGTAITSGVSITNSSGANLFDAATASLAGCTASNNFEVYTTNPLPTFPCDMALFDVNGGASVHYLTGSSATGTALGIKGALVIGLDPTVQTADAGLHVGDLVNGINSIPLATYTNPIARFDSSASASVIPYESSNNGIAQFLFHTPGAASDGSLLVAHGSSGNLLRLSISGQQANLWGASSGTFLAGDFNAPGRLIFGGITNPGILTGTLTAPRLYNFLDHSGTVCFVADLCGVPAVTTNGDILAVVGGVPAWATPGTKLTVVTGAGLTYAQTDNNTVYQQNSATVSTFVLPIVSSLSTGWRAGLINVGAGTITLNVTTSSITSCHSGTCTTGSSLTITTGQYAFFYSNSSGYTAMILTP